MTEHHSSIKPKRVGLKSWLWVKPVISEFHRLPRWLREIAGWAFIGAALAMVGIGEYALSEAMIFLGLIAFALQIYDWQVVEQKPNLARMIKGVAIIGVIIMLTYFAMVFVRIKGTKAWSNLLDKQVQEHTPMPAPTPTSIPTPTPTPAPIASPSPSRPAPKVNKESKATELQRRRRQALKDLYYRKP